MHSFTVPPSKYEYIYNSKYKKAILLKSISRLSQARFGRKYNKRNKNKYDVGNRIITTESGYQAILRFFKQEDFQDFELVVSAGSETHESCIFIRKDGDGYEAIYYNPNYSDRQDGVQYSHVVRQLFHKFGRKLKRIQAYHSPCFNLRAQCSALTWAEMMNHMSLGLSPFSSNTHVLEDYKHYVTQSAYSAYHGLC